MFDKVTSILQKVGYWAGVFSSYSAWISDSLDRMPTPPNIPGDGSAEKTPQPLQTLQSENEKKQEKAEMA